MRIIEISCIIKEQSASEDRQMEDLKKFFNVNESCNPRIHYMIDLSDTNNQVFVDFLVQLRAYYLRRVKDAKVCIANRIFEMWIESERE